MIGRVQIDNESKRDRKREKWLSSPYMVKWYRDGDITFKKSMKSTEDVEDEADDIYIYKTLRYPPNSTPPSVN